MAKILDNFRHRLDVVYNNILPCFQLPEVQIVQIYIDYSYE